MSLLSLWILDLFNKLLQTITKENKEIVQTTCVIGRIRFSSKAELRNILGINLELDCVKGSSNIKQILSTPKPEKTTPSAQDQSDQQPSNPRHGAPWRKSLFSSSSYPHSLALFEEWRRDETRQGLLWSKLLEDEAEIQDICPSREPEKQSTGPGEVQILEAQQITVWVQPKPTSPESRQSLLWVRQLPSSQSKLFWDHLFLYSNPREWTAKFGVIRKFSTFFSSIFSPRGSSISSSVSEPNIFDCTRDYWL